MSVPNSQSRVWSMTATHSLLCVYRRANARLVEDLVQRSYAAGGSSHLWALDSPDRGLEDFTIGHGPGGRFELLNRLLLETDPSSSIVVCDDDVSFTRGSLADLLRISGASAFELSQPAHGLRSHSTYRFCRRRPWAHSRRTNFIEIGPVVVVDGAARSRFTPFPDATRMGWGVDLLWRDAAIAGACIGIVDEVTVSHHTPLGNSYDMEAEGLRLGGMLRERGLARVEDGQETVATWLRWQSSPPWR